MKSLLLFFILLSVLFTINGCKKDDSNPVQTPTVVASEGWYIVMNNDSTKHAAFTLDKKSDGTISVTGLSCYSYQGTVIACPFEEGSATVTDSIVKFTAHGTAVDPAAPSGSQNSRFTFSTNGVAIVGTGHGTYTINFTASGWPDQLTGSFASKRTNGRGVTFGDVVAYKPNIYIYPPAQSTLSVNLEFPMGGGVIESIPAYREGWTVEVEPSGRIGGQYDYLFYESSAPDAYQYQSGWIVRTDTLTQFFTGNLSATGFNEREIKDFIDYWIPRLKSSSYYVVYPQYANDIEKVIKLKIDAAPDNVLRLFYVIKGSENNDGELREPVIPVFSRKGFVVTEWGVVLK